MLEVLLALALITMAVLVLMGLATTALNARQKSLDTEAARQVARAELRRVVNSALEDSPAGARGKLFGYRGKEPMESGKTRVGVTEFSYSVYVKPLAGSTKPNRLVEVRVEVWWWGDQNQERRGMGKLHYQIGQLLDEPNGDSP